jgi:hypothetical protein
MDSCFIKLKPLDWYQTISTESIINPTGRSLLMDGSVSDHNLILSNGARLSELSVNFSFSKSDGKPLLGSGQPLEHGVGLFMFFQHQGKVGGWFSLDTQSYMEVWDQVREGTYTDCVIDMEVGPVGSSGPAWTWDVEARFFVLSVSICFHRKAPVAVGE